MNHGCIFVFYYPFFIWIIMAQDCCDYHWPPKPSSPVAARVFFFGILLKFSPNGITYYMNVPNYQ